MTPPIIAFFNNKGGVGKTSLVYHLAWMYTDLRLRVVAADLDPQANLTAAFLDEDRLEELWPDGNHTQTVYGGVQPLIKGIGDVADPYLEAVDPNLALLVGDILLSSFEDELATQWPDCLDRKERAFRVISAFWRILQNTARAHRAQIILMDLGPNLGAINRAALIAADYVVIPLSPDLFSLQGLRNLGPTLRRWRAEWGERLARNPAPQLKLPAGRMQPVGYVVLQHSVRLDRPVKAYSPGQPEVLTDLVNTYYELRDMEGYQGASERLIKVDRDNADLALGLAGAYLTNTRVALALRAFRNFLKRWPDHPRAGEIRRTVADLEGALPELLADLDVPPDQAFDVAVQHELIQSSLAQGQYREVRKAAEALLRQYPRFVPALNNLSLAHWADGRPDQAITAAQRVLELEPDNVHALSNLVRFLCADGRQAEAQPFAERLKASPAPAADVWLKKIEGLSYIGDDQGVLDVFQQAEETIEPQSSQSNAMLYHLVAVAAGRLGREAEARSHWQRALKLSPGFALARENLDDLKLPPGERHGPWAFTLSYWVSQQAIRDLARALGSVSKRGADDEAAARAAGRYVREHPEVVKVTPVLLERGDRQGREFALRLASLAKMPELLAALKDFALGQRGPDEARLEAAHIVNQAGLLPSGPVRLWIQGEWQELLLLGFEIYAEPEEPSSHSAPVTQWLQEATLALRAGDVKRAESLLRQALAEEPDAPDLLNNLAAAYSLQGRAQESEALVREIHARHPDYFFGCTNLARILIQQGEYERARELLDPLLQQKRMHITEFDGLCAAEIDLFLAQGNVDAARSWLNMWESTESHSPMLEQFRRRIGASRQKRGRPAGKPGRLKKFLGG